MGLVRPLVDADRSDIAAIVAQVYQLRLPQAQFNWPSPVILDELQKSQGFVWVSPDSVIGGFVCYRDNVGQTLDITVLATGTRYVRQGVQAKIIKSLQAFAAAHNKDIMLEVHEQNLAARQLYSKCGFQMLNVRRNYYSDGASAVVMKWPLDKAGC